MATHKQKFTGDNTQLLEAYREQAQQLVKLEQQLQKLGQASRRGSDQQVNSTVALNRSLTGMMQQLYGAAAAYVSFGKAIDLANAELEESIALQRQASEAGRKIAQSRGDTILNAWGQSDEQLKAIRARSEEIAKQSGIKVEHVNAAVAAALGAGAGTTTEKLDAVGLASKVTAHKPETLSSVAAAILNVSQTAKVSQDEALALMMSGGSAAFIADPKQQMKMLRQSMAGGVASSRAEPQRAAEQAVELMSAITQMVGDDEGPQARTAAISLSSQLDKFFTEGIQKTYPGSSLKYTVKPPEDPGAIIDRIRYLANRPELAEQFLQGADFDSLVESSFRNLLRDKEGTGRESQLVREAERAVSYDTAPLTQKIFQLEGLDLQMQGETERRKEEAVHELGIASEQPAIRADIRTAYENALRIANRHFFGGSWNTFQGLKTYDIEHYFRPDDFSNIWNDPRRQLQTRAELIRGKFEGREMPAEVQKDLSTISESVQLIDNMINALTHPTPGTERRGVPAGDDVLGVLQKIADNTSEMVDREKQRQPQTVPQAEMGRHRER